MKISWTAVGRFIVKALPFLIHTAEDVHAGPSAGETKKAWVKEIIRNGVEAMEGVAGKDLLNDPEVAKAYDAINDAVVAFENLLAKKSGSLTSAAGGTP